MRTITDHIVEGDIAPQLTIKVLDEPGPGGANHDYEISATYNKGETAPLCSWISDAVIHIDSDGKTTVTLDHIHFQNGPIKEVGVNGITGEAMAAILIDRLRSFQAGPFACNDNHEALLHFEKGLNCLQKRTRERIRRGVEGTNQQ